MILPKTPVFRYTVSMPDPQQTTGQQSAAGDFFAHLPKPLALPYPEEVYDRLMEQIEPELMTAQLPTLDERYKDEAPEQADARRERYAKAFAAYDEKFREYRRDIESQARRYQRTAVSSTEEQSRLREQERIVIFEQSFSSAP